MHRAELRDPKPLEGHLTNRKVHLSFPFVFSRYIQAAKSLGKHNIFRFPPPGNLSRALAAQGPQQPEDAGDGTGCCKRPGDQARVAGTQHGERQKPGG